MKGRHVSLPMVRVLSVPVSSHLVAGLVMAAMLVVAGGVQAADHHVYPGDSIQAAINAAVTDDTVIVHEGTYVERINFAGKAITVRSEDPTDPAVAANTVIDGGAGGSVVSFYSGEGNSSVLAGLTITNGRATYGGGVFCVYSSPTIQGNTVSGSRAEVFGGGIYCSHCSPTIQSNTISGNHTDGGDGGGIHCWYSSPTIQSNTISGNQASLNGAGIYCQQSSPTIQSNTISGNCAYTGGGIYCSESSPTIESNTISDNEAVLGGGIWCLSSSPAIQSNTISDNEAWLCGGICCLDSSPTIESNTISDNTAESWGGGIYCQQSSPTICNCIIAFSGSGGGIRVASGSPSVSYCDVYGNTGGNYVGMADQTGSNGNISEAPLFAGSGDYHLRSKGGRLDPGSSSWVIDTEHSACIDTGDPASDCSNEPAPNGGRINMGAYGNTPEASKSLLDEEPPTLSLDSPSPAILWPPNHKAVEVTISGSVVDEGSGVAQAWLVVDDEYDELDATYDITGELDGDGSFEITIDLIPWRGGNDRDGREYTITLYAVDNADNGADPVSVVVRVPHDQRKK
jgi:parallel beta-helix repeat protein